MDIWIKTILIQKDGMDSQMHLKVVQNVKVLKIQLSGVVKDFKMIFFGKKMDENWKKCHHWKFILSSFNNIANCKFSGTQIKFLWSIYHKNLVVGKGMHMSQVEKNCAKMSLNEWIMDDQSWLSKISLEKNIDFHPSMLRKTNLICPLPNISI